MHKALFAGVAALLALAAGPALAQDGMKRTRGFEPPDRTLEALPREATTPAERAQVRRDWNEMSREWDARQRGEIQRHHSMPRQFNRGDDVRDRAEEAHRSNRNPCPGPGRCDD